MSCPTSSLSLQTVQNSLLKIGNRKKQIRKYYVVFQNSFIVYSIDIRSRRRSISRIWSSRTKRARRIFNSYRRRLMSLNTVTPGTFNFITKQVNKTYRLSERSGWLLSGVLAGLGLGWSCDSTLSAISEPSIPEANSNNR